MLQRISDGLPEVPIVALHHLKSRHPRGENIPPDCGHKKIEPHWSRLSLIEGSKIQKPTGAMTRPIRELRIFQPRPPAGNFEIYKFIKIHVGLGLREVQPCLGPVRGPFWAHSGPIWGHCRTIVFDFGAILDPFGVPCAGSYSGPIWDPFGDPFWVPFGNLFGSHLGFYLGFHLGSHFGPCFTLIILSVYRISGSRAKERRCT